LGRRRRRKKKEGEREQEEKVDDDDTLLSFFICFLVAEEARTNESDHRHLSVLALCFSLHFLSFLATFNPPSR